MNNYIMRKKLLQINVTANWGSTGKIAEQIGMLAMQQGWESYVAYGRMMNPSKSILIKIGCQLDVYVHYFLSRFLDMEGLMSRRATRKLVKEIERIKPDVVHLHNIHGHYLNYPILFEYLTSQNIPVVWTLHDQWVTTGHCHFNTVGCERWKTGCFDCPVKERYGLDKSERNYDLKRSYFTSLNNTTIVTVSDWLKFQIEQSYLGKFPIKVIKNGVDTDVFKPQLTDIRSKYGIGSNKILLGVASAWIKGKGLEDFKKLKERLPEGWVIVLVGAIQEGQIPSDIIHVERTQNQIELAQLYTSANVVASLSSSETFGLTIAEGLACGTPAIVYNNTALPELVDTNTGAIVEQGDIDGIIESLKRFEHKTESIRNACRERAMNCFNQTNSFDSYIKLYGELIGR
jgi:putative colanic acid biosynthesis glycosyltransferase